MSDQDKIKDRWKENYKNLLNEENLKVAVEKNEEATGPNGIPV